MNLPTLNLETTEQTSPPTAQPAGTTRPNVFKWLVGLAARLGLTRPRRTMLPATLTASTEIDLQKAIRARGVPPQIARLLSQRVIGLSQDYEKADQYIERYRNDYRESLINMTALQHQIIAREDQAEVQITQAISALENGDFQSASTAMHAIVNKEHGLQTQVLGEIARLARLRFDYSQAAALYEQATQLCEPYSFQEANYLCLAGQSAFASDNPDLAEPLFLRAQAIYENRSGRHDAVLIDLLRDIALLYEEQGRIAEAVTITARLENLCREHFGKNHPRRASALNMLGSFYNSQKQHHKAIECYEKTIEIWRALNNRATDPMLARSLLDSARVLLEIDQYTQAEKQLREAVDIFGKTFSTPNPEIAQTNELIATALRLQGRLPDAEFFYLRAISQWESSGGGRLVGMAHTLDQLADLYLTAGRYAETKALRYRSLEIKRKTLGAEHVEVASTLDALADISHIQGDIDMARQLYQQALAIRSYANTGDYKQINASLQKLGKLSGAGIMPSAIYAQLTEGNDSSLNFVSLARQLLDNGRQEDAEMLFRQALKLRRRSLGDAHTQTISLYHEMASVFERQKKYNEAASFYEKVLQDRKKRLPADHPLVTSIDNKLKLLSAATIHEESFETIKQSKKNTQEDEKLYHRAMMSFALEHGNHHPAVANMSIKLAGLYCAKRQYKRAEPLYKQALHIKRKQHKKDSPQLAAIHNSIGIMYYHMGHYVSARKSLTDALRILEKAYPDKHPSIKKVEKNISMIPCSRRS
ncbi:MAG: tetratricopeptide repeat protein [Pseudomonadota bacterium]